MTPKLVSLFLDLVFPRVCAVCGGELSLSRDAGLLCPVCMDELEAYRITGRCCPGCGIPLVSEGEHCTSCRTETDTEPVPGTALFLYRGAVRVLIRRYKFEGNREIARFAAGEIACKLDGNDAGLTVVPVPSSRAARRRNGWGHMEEVSRRLRGMGFAVRTDLLKRRRSAEQKQLGRAERMENSRHSFSVSHAARGRDLLLIDDIRTTGATLHGACSALAGAGARVRRWIVLAID